MSRTNSAGAFSLVNTKRRTSGCSRSGRAESMSAVRSAPATVRSSPPFFNSASAAAKKSRKVSVVPNSALRRRSEGGTRPEPSTRHGGFVITASNIGSAVLSPVPSFHRRASRMRRRSPAFVTSPQRAVNDPLRPSAAALRSAASASTASLSSPTARQPGCSSRAASETTPQPVPSSARAAPSGKACSAAKPASRSASALKRKLPSGCSSPAGKAARAASMPAVSFIFLPPATGPHCTDLWFRL